MNKDFVEMLFALLDAKAEFLVVGAHAASVHGHARNTGDLDIWVRPSTENAPRVMRALHAFGAPTFDWTVEDFTKPDWCFQMGMPPGRIDLLTGIAGVSFDDAWPNRVDHELQGRAVPFLGLEELLRNKRAAGRPKDLADVAALEKLKRKRK